jgi:hypothetical protein
LRLHLKGRKKTECGGGHVIPATRETKKWEDCGPACPGQKARLVLIKTKQTNKWKNRAERAGSMA